MQKTTASNPWRASSSSWWCAKGFPATSSIAFGTRSVSGRMRVASPPASTTHCTALVPQRNGGAVLIERESHLIQPGGAHRLAQPRGIGRIEEEKAAGARADELAAA